MCFSATASFSAAVVIGTVGVITLTKATKTGCHKHLPYAAIPLLFAIQQATEGLLWLDIVNVQAGACRPFLINGFIGFAEVFWPAFAPLSVLLLEPVGWRNTLLKTLAVAGFALASWLLYIMISLPYNVTAQEAGLVYKNTYRPGLFIYIAYGVVTTLPFALSTHRRVQWFFAAIIVGLLVSLMFYARAYISVWCFFAAMASALVYAYFANLKTDQYDIAQ